MKLPPRIVAPIIVAIICTSVLIGVLWWQLAISTELSKQIIDEQAANPQIVEQQVITPDIIDPDDKALMHLRQGDVLALRGDWIGAEKQYELSVKEGGDLPALRKLAQAQLQRRNLDGVKNTIRKLKGAGAKPEDLLLLDSIVKLRTGELVEAKNVLESASDSPQKSYGLALLSIVSGDHQAAQTHLQAVINGWEPVLRANAKTLSASYDEYSLFKDSSNFHLITLLSRALAQVQECELALPLLVQVTNQKDDYRDAWIVQGYCELVTERTSDAIRSLEQAYAIDPQKSEIQYFLAKAYSAASDSDSAITFFEYAIANGFQPENEARQYIAEEALKSGDTSLALSQYEILIKADKPIIASYEGYVSVAIAVDKKEDAYVHALKATEVFEKNGKAFELLGLAALETDRLDEARLAFQKALDLDPFLDFAKQKLQELQSGA